MHVTYFQANRLFNFLKIFKLKCCALFGDKNWCVRLVGKPIRGGIYLLATSKLIITLTKVKIYPKHIWLYS